MCMCGKPTINGQPGYSWDGKAFSTRPVDPPTLRDYDELIYDEPGRCGGGLDSHCHHFRVTRNFGMYSLLVKHGGGEERISLGSQSPGIKVLERLDSNDRYWLLQLLYGASG